MFTAKNISYIQKINALQPQPKRPQPAAVLCSHCAYINELDFLFCTNCGYPLQNNQLTDAYAQRLQHRKALLFKAENAVMAARVVLYIMGSFLALGFFFIFAESSRKYIVVMMALLLSGLFFFLAFWSRKNPFTALLSAFIILIAFSAINIFRNIANHVTTLPVITGMLICVALLLVILKGLQGAYRISLIKEELQTNL